MNSEPLEAAGDLASGLLLARAVEPTAGEAATDHTSGNSCLNCGITVSARYCGACGQSVHVHSTLASILHDLLHGVYHLEGKIWHTIPELLIRPGALTRRYIAGERVKFVSPLALFLFALFLLFASFESAGVPFQPQAVVIRNGQQLSSADVVRYLAQARSTSASLKQQLTKVPPGSAKAKSFQQGIEDAQDEAEALAAAARVNAGLKAVTVGGSQPVTGWSSLDRRIRAATANPPLLSLKLQANAHKYAWALIPLSVPFLWIVFALSAGVPSFRPYGFHNLFVVHGPIAVRRCGCARGSWRPHQLGATVDPDPPVPPIARGLSID